MVLKLNHSSYSFIIKGIKDVKTNILWCLVFKTGIPCFMKNAQIKNCYLALNL